MTADKRRVVVTIVGDATAPRTSNGHLLIRYGRGLNGGSFLLTENAPGVTVEDAPLVRKWTRGDVIAGDTSVWMRDRDGLWRSHRQGFPTLTDPEVSATTDIGPDGYDVLRYQAGEK